MAQNAELGCRDGDIRAGGGAAEPVRAADRGGAPPDERSARRPLSLLPQRHPLRRPALWRSPADAASAQLGHEPLEDTLAKVLPAFGMVLLVIFGPVLVFMLCASVGSKVVDKKKAD